MACSSAPLSTEFPLIEVSVTVQGAGSGSIVNVTQVQGADSGFPFEINCTVVQGGASGACSSRFLDAGGTGTMVLRATPAPGHQVSSLGGDCAESSGEMCSLSFAGVAYAGEGRVALRLNALFTIDSVAPTTVAIGDDFENTRAWRHTIVSVNGTVTDSASVESSGGSPGGFLYMEHRLLGIGNVVVHHWFDETTYDPATQGPITSLTYGEDHLVIDPAFSGAAVGGSFLVEQAGQVYTMVTSTFSNTSWQRWTQDGITAADFSPAPGPDFSSAGAPLRFGFGRSNSNTAGGNWISKHGLDNFLVEIER